jgi:methylglutaconyl-CoA hydratase
LIGPFVIEPAVSRKKGKVLCQMTLAAHEWKTDWAQQRTYAKVLQDQTELDIDLAHFTQTGIL